MLAAIEFLATGQMADIVHQHIIGLGRHRACPGLDRIDLQALLARFIGRCPAQRDGQRNAKPQLAKRAFGDGL